MVLLVIAMFLKCLVLQYALISFAIILLAIIICSKLGKCHAINNFLLKSFNRKEFTTMNKNQQKSNSDLSPQDEIGSEDSSIQSLKCGDSVQVPILTPTEGSGDVDSSVECVHDEISMRIPEIDKTIEDTGNSRKIAISTDIDTDIEYSISTGDNTPQVAVYDGPFEVYENCKITIKATAKGYSHLEKTISFEINDFKVPVPRITFNETAREIVMEVAIENAIIRYTLDGSMPSKKSDKYTGPIRLKKSRTIKCYAEKSGWNPSEVEEKKVKIIPTPEERVRAYTEEDANHVLGISYRGESHIKSDTLCQDYHSFKQIDENWSLAIVSDGAGSALHSDLGSRAVCYAFTEYITKLISSNSEYFNGNIPSEKNWDIEFRGMLSKFQSDLKIIAQKNSIELKTLAATIIILLFSKKGYLTAHVGDGRGAVKVAGQWIPIFTPHKGAEANMTIFSTTIDFAANPAFKMSGNYVPETHVSKESIEAFALMSDGCECGLWQMNERINLPDGDFRIEERNIPFARGLSDAIELCNDIPAAKAKLISFVTEYNNPLRREIDDKTLLIGKI
jgi:hypothetical protein